MAEKEQGKSRSLITTAALSMIGPIGPALGTFFGTIVKNWKIVLFGCLIAFIFYQNYMTFEVLRPFGIRTIPGITQEIDKTKNELNVCEVSRTSLKEAIDSTNDQINHWVRLSTSLQKQHDKLSEELVRLKKKSEEDVNAILNEPHPKTCEAAIQYLRDAVTTGDLK